mmetsp:Transcript_123871/g.264006  ORF Transcript_123871/g.264006 Transcript_123871/m.264006 type:complete len:123 (+) Transcript_123871:77-445(+)
MALVMKTISLAVLIVCTSALHLQAPPDDAHMISVSQTKLHSCIQGAKSQFDAAASWTKDNADIFKAGTCEELWGLATEIPVHEFTPFGEIPFCTELASYGAPGLKECWISKEEVMAHIKNTR